MSAQEHVTTVKVVVQVLVETIALAQLEFVWGVIIPEETSYQTIILPVNASTVAIEYVLVKFIEAKVILIAVLAISNALPCTQEGCIVVVLVVTRSESQANHYYHHEL